MRLSRSIDVREVLSRITRGELVEIPNDELVAEIGAQLHVDLSQAAEILDHAEAGDRLGLKAFGIPSSWSGRAFFWDHSGADLSD